MTSLLGLLSSTAGFVKVRYLTDKEIIDNAVFRLHRFTSAIMFMFCILCSATTLLGDPIDCIAGPEFKDREKVIDTYCWITTTFTLPHQQNKPVGTHVAGPGIGTYIPGVHDTVYHSYYQWVPFMLFLQGIMFYTPHWLWKNWEEGTIKKLSAGIRGNFVETKEELKDRQNTLVQYFIKSMSFHNGYAFCYFLCEILNFINVVGNIFFVDKFLGNAFLTYGTKVLQYVGEDQINRTDPMIAVFPRLTKCSLNMYGPSGTITNKDFLCVLPLNILNEKIYIFLWFWFILLSALSGLALLYSIGLATFPSARRVILEKRFKYKTATGMTTLIRRIKVGDFLILHLLGQNMCSKIFCDFLEELTSQLNNNGPYNEITPIYPAKEFPKEA